MSTLFALAISAVVFDACSGGGGGHSPVPGGTPTPVSSSVGVTPTPTPLPSGYTPTPLPSGSTPTPVPSGSKPTPTPTPTPLPTYALPSASPAVQSAYTVQSYPASGLSVLLDGTPFGTTPTTITPSYQKTLHMISIVPSSTASPYVVSFAQTANGSHTIVYNQTIDTNGKISSFSATPFSRSRGRVAAATQRGRATGLRRMAVTHAHRARYDAQRIVVHFDPSRFSGGRTVASLEGAHGAVRAATFSQSSRDITRIVTLARGTDVDSALRAFSAEYAVTSVDRVRLRYPLSSTSSGNVYPNDPGYTSGSQWYLDVLELPAAWGYGLGSPSVPIAIIDTGYDPLQTEVAPGVTFSERIVGGTITSASDEATDTDGHGTFVSGIANAQTNNGAGYAGIAYGASLQEYKVYTDSTAPVADSADVAEAIREAVAHGAKVILAATGGEADAGPDPLERDAVAYALANGVTVVAGAGDEGDSTLDYPAGYDGVISVGASAVNDTSTPGTVVGSGNFEYVPTYSNGPGIASLVAPGGDPSGASDTDGIHWIANAYTTQPIAGDAACASGTTPAQCGILMSGTAPAAAEVAGAAALLLSQNGSLVPSQIATLLKESAVNISDPGQGSGRLDVHNAIVRLVGDTTAAPAPPPPSYQQFVAFAYANSGGTVPVILDQTYLTACP
ncbi:MAG: S8 family serine peptidase [Candidatus Eremiobacteraeota bacterium]|nr:S8 family serine peptidase [Candidatus Eremiobacteraeota bacterium]